MTTIVYNHKTKEIAVDSRCTDQNGVILSDTFDKTIEIDGVIFLYSGQGDDGIELAKIISGGEAHTEALKATVIFIKDGAAWMGSYTDCTIDTWELTYSVAIGSGADFALSAVDFGKSASEAIEYAKSRDSNSGGKVKVFKVE